MSWLGSVADLLEDTIDARRSELEEDDVPSAPVGLPDFSNFEMSTLPQTHRTTSNLSPLVRRGAQGSEKGKMQRTTLSPSPSRTRGIKSSGNTSSRRVGEGEEEQNYDPSPYYYISRVTYLDSFTITIHVETFSQLQVLSGGHSCSMRGNAFHASYTEPVSVWQVLVDVYRLSDCQAFLHPTSTVLFMPRPNGGLIRLSDYYKVAQHTAVIAVGGWNGGDGGDGEGLSKGTDDVHLGSPIVGGNSMLAAHNKSLLGPAITVPSTPNRQLGYTNLSKSVPLNHITPESLGINSKAQGFLSFGVPDVSGSHDHQEPGLQQQYGREKSAERRSGTASSAHHPSLGKAGSTHLNSPNVRVVPNYCFAFGLGLQACVPGQVRLAG